MVLEGVFMDVVTTSGTGRVEVVISGNDDDDDGGGGG